MTRYISLGVLVISGKIGNRQQESMDFLERLAELERAVER